MMSKTPLSTLTALETAKYYCTLSLLEYKRPTPFMKGDLDPSKLYRLPLPRELRDDTRVNISGPTDLNLVGDLLNNGLPGIGSTIGAEALRQVGQLGAGQATSLAGRVAGALGADDTQRQAIETNMGTALNADALGSALQQNLGVAPNPNPAISFRGPELRTLNLSWVFMAANRQEAANIRKMIRELKAAALPESSNGGASILSYPKLAQLNFYPWDSSGSGRWGWGPDSIIKMKCAFMASVNVEYNSGVAPAFFHDGENEPVMVGLNIDFREVEYFLSHDYGGGYRDFKDTLGLLGDLASTVVDVALGGNSGGVDENQQVEEEAADT